MTSYILGTISNKSYFSAAPDVRVHFKDNFSKNVGNAKLFTNSFLDRLRRFAILKLSKHECEEVLIYIILITLLKVIPFGN